MAIVSAMALFGLPGSVAAAPGEGSISGTVVNHEGSPIEGVCVMVEGFGTTSTDIDGNYLVDAIPVGSYRVQYSDCNDPRVYLTEWWANTPNEANATWVEVFDEADNPLPTVQLMPGVSVTGTVTDGGGNPIQDINVRLDPQGPYDSSSATTDASGQYRVGPVADGNYHLEFFDGQSPVRYAPEWWSGAYVEDDANEIQLLVADGTEAPGYDIQLEGASTISGHVQDAAGNPVAGICVASVLDDGEGGQWLSGTQSDGAGNYSLDEVPPGNLFVHFDDCDDPKQYRSQWNGGFDEQGDATPIGVSEGSSHTVDATMQAGVTVSGNVTDLGGNPLENVDVSFDRVDGGHRGWATTDSSGNYSSSPMEPGDYKVRFEADDNAYAVQFWDGQATWNAGDTLSLSASTNGIDAQLAASAQISGRVTDPSGDPAPNICIGAIHGLDDDEIDSVDWANTDAAGNYVLQRLPAGPTRVIFEDCNDTGPYLEQWYSGTRNLDDAHVFNLTPGSTQANIDVQMVAAAQISGTVRNTDGTPLGDICVQASTEDFLGDMDRTEDDGTYRLRLADGGDYKVQFADCGDPEDGIGGGTYLAQWWGGGLDPSTGDTISLAPGQLVTGVNASLSPAGGTATVSGRVTNVRGEGLQACIALYMPTEAVRFMPTDANGNYEFTDVPTGTWTVGFLGCGDDDVSPVIPDAGATGVFYNSAWLGGALLNVTEDSPDPIAQGGFFETLSPGESFKADMCFGCKSITVKPPVVGDDYILVDFEELGLVTSPDGGVGATAGLSYSVRCSSATGAPTSATQTSYPVRVEGFTPGEPYRCTAEVLSGSTEVAASASFDVTVGTKQAPSEPTGTGNGSGSGSTGNPSNTGSTGGTGGSGGSTGSGSSSSPANLAFTGGNLGVLVGLALVLVLAGLGSLVANRSRRAGTDA